MAGTYRADALVPGTIVVDAFGRRLFAAFDVDVRDDVVTVWTAVRDQDAGQPRSLELGASDLVNVA